MRLWLVLWTKAAPVPLPEPQSPYVVYRIVDAHACFRLRQWLGQRKRVQGSSRSRFSDPYLRRTYGLIKLEGRRRERSCANA
jgi:hypothetical protein